MSFTVSCLAAGLNATQYAPVVRFEDRLSRIDLHVFNRGIPSDSHIVDESVDGCDFKEAIFDRPLARHVKKYSRVQIWLKGDAWSQPLSGPRSPLPKSVIGPSQFAARLRLDSKDARGVATIDSDLPTYPFPSNRMRRGVKLGTSSPRQPSYGLGFVACS